MKIEIYCEDDDSLTLLFSLTKQIGDGRIHVTHGLYDLRDGVKFHVDKNYNIHQVRKGEKDEN